MPSAGLLLIEQYRTLSKELEQQNCEDLLRLDQEVPQSRMVCDDSLVEKPLGMKTDPGDMQDDVYSMYIFNSLMACGGDSSNSSDHNSAIINTNARLSDAAVDNGCDSFRISKDIHYGSNSSINSVSISDCTSSHQMVTTCQVSHNTSSSSSSSLTFSSSTPFSHSPSFLSSSSSPSPVSSTNLPTVVISSAPATSTNSFQPKINTFVTQRGGCGGTMTSFLNAQVPTEAFEDTNAIDILDLDKQPFSFYDDHELFRLNNVVIPEAAAAVQNVVSESGSPDLMLGDYPSLEEAMSMMRNDFVNVCDGLNIPHDPERWDPDQVQLWVSWVCRKYGVPDISRQLPVMNGHELSSHPSLGSYGQSGLKISEELEFWKAACSAFPTQHYMTNPMLPPRQDFLTKPAVPPCVSPSPSSCSNSQDSVSIRSDSSDDEMSAAGKPAPRNPSAKVPTRPGPGRGHHKQTIHLWQFLRELLVSQEDHSDCIRWLDRKAGIFKIEDSKKVASLWGKRKNRPAMNYDKLSRSVRQYYKKNIIKKTEQSKRLVYQFCDGIL